MNYDWEEIFKSKSDKELYKIFNGQSLLNSEQKKFAENELNNRGFDFENIEKYKRKWELKDLIEEERYENKKAKTFFADKNSSTYLISGIFGFASIFFTIITGYYTDFSIQEVWFPFFVGISMCITGFFGYNKKKKREKYRETKIAQLKNESDN